MVKIKYFILGDAGSPHVLKWASQLCNDFDCYIFSFNGASPEIYQNCAKNHVYAVGDKNIKGLRKLYYFFLLCFIVIFQTLKKHPKFINAHYITSYGLIGLLSKYLCSAKLIATCWGSDILTIDNSRVRKSVVKQVLSRASYIVGDSVDIIEKVKSVTSVTCDEIFFGVDRVEQDCIKDPNLFFSNRALEPLYNIDQVITFFSSIACINPDARLVVAHSGSCFNDLKKLAKDLNLVEKVKFVGRLSNEEQQLYYEKSSFFISIPSTDGTSVSLLEAMSFGCIPIVSDLPANREWVSSENGFIEPKSFIDKYVSLNEEQLDIMRNINYQLIKDKGIWSLNYKRFFKRLMELS